MFFVSGDDDDISDDSWFLEATEKEKAIAEAKNSAQNIRITKDFECLKLILFRN